MTIIEAVLKLYADIDSQVDAFGRQSGLHCKPGCGYCCENPQIETTVTEVLPLAAHLWSTGEAESTITAIAKRQAKGQCVFYKPDPLVAGHGRCGVYAFRPGTCRLFASVAAKDKNNRNTLITCKVIKQAQPNEFQQAQDKINQGLAIPQMSRHTTDVLNIDPVHGKTSMPINQAVGQALERLGWQKHRSDKGEEVHDQ